VNISGENYTGSTGEVFVVSPGNLHFMGSQTGKVDYYTLLFPLEYVSFQSNDLLEKEVMAPLKSGKRMIKPQLGAGLSDICDNLIALEHSDLTLSATQKEQEIAENTSDNRNNLIIQFEIKSRLLLFFKRVLQSGFILENNTSGRNTTEKEMISYIQQNFTRKISLKEFGNQFHLSEKYISRYFKEHFHITISQYINHLRMERARQLLQETTLPVTEVAMRCGYENVSYFIRSFKKMYGNPPLKYRNEI
jgi:AraC-like DNA-binding protein